MREAQWRLKNIKACEICEAKVPLKWFRHKNTPKRLCAKCGKDKIPSSAFESDFSYYVDSVRRLDQGMSKEAAKAQLRIRLREEKVVRRNK